MAEAFLLEQGELHIWFALVDRLEPASKSKYLSLLTDDERHRHDRYYFDRHREEFLTTRALERFVLSSYLSVSPHDLRFERTAEGKPQLAFPRSDVWFNLSNTRGLVACIIGKVPQLGIDVENVTSRVTNLDVARRFFAPAEVEELESNAAERQAWRFFEYWTLKESYLKARGLGLSYPLDAFFFSIAERSADIRFIPGADDSAQGWQFFHFRPTADHQLAVGARSPSRLRLSVFRTVPFIGEFESIERAS